jgi:antitoxin (DNA-binding transcriptional repressor) of toxin-antitoxin stability system
MIVERRKQQRLRSLLGGRVSFNQKNSTLDCIVRNLSEDGALLVVSDAVALPNAFDLDIARHQRSYVARIRWRDGERVGVAFDTQAAADIVPLDMARRLKHCEQDNARLKTRIRQLTEAG